MSDTETPCSDPPCDYLDGYPCDTHETEQAHAGGNHQHCGKDCETAFPWDQMRNAILHSAIPGSASMLDELLRRAADRSALMDAHLALVSEASKRYQRIQELEKGELWDARQTNQRLNREKQRLGSELAAYRRAVQQWASTPNGGISVPLSSLDIIAKAAGLTVPEQWVLHYQQVQDLKDRVKVLEGMLRIVEPWVCPGCFKENNRDVCVICETDRPDPEDTLEDTP